MEPPKRNSGMGGFPVSLHSHGRDVRATNETRGALSCRLPLSVSHFQPFVFHFAAHLTTFLKTKKTYGKFFGGSLYQ